MFLFMEEPEHGVTTEKHVITFLERLGFQEKKEEEPFGRMTRVGNPQGGFLQDFVRSGWLETYKIQKTDPVEHEYRWGFRARACVDKMQVLKFVASIYGADARDWAHHFDIAQKSRKIKGEKNAETEGEDMDAEDSGF